MVCQRCKKEYNSEDGYIEYGFIEGKPFMIGLCGECKNSLSDVELEKLKKDSLSEVK